MSSFKATDKVGGSLLIPETPQKTPEVKELESKAEKIEQQTTPPPQNMTDTPEIQPPTPPLLKEAQHNTAMGYGPESLRRRIKEANDKKAGEGTVPEGNAVIKKGFDKEAIAWTEKSNESIKSKNWIEVIRTTSVAIKIDPFYPLAYVNRSLAYLEKGFTDEAFADCQKALELDSANNAARNNRGLFYLRTGEQDKAKGDFETACNGGLEVSCNNLKIITGYRPSEKVQFYLNKSEEFFNKKDWDNVVKYTSEISNNATALSVRAAAYAYKGMFNDAIKDCDEAIKLNPDLALAYNNKGFVLELMEKKKEALLNYEFACNLGMPLGCNNIKRLSANPNR